MRLWPRRRRANPGTGRDDHGRLYDGDTVRPPAPTMVPDDHTRLLPIITPAEEIRRRGGGGW